MDLLKRDSVLKTNVILQTLYFMIQDIIKVLQQMRGGQKVDSMNPEDKYQVLEKYGRDLTALAQEGKLDPVIGRDQEIRRVVQVLSRRTKNNPVLIGEPGTGKQPLWKDWLSVSLWKMFLKD